MTRKTWWVRWPEEVFSMGGNYIPLNCAVNDWRRLPQSAKLNTPTTIYLTRPSLHLIALSSTIIIAPGEKDCHLAVTRLTCNTTKLRTMRRIHFMSRGTKMTSRGSSKCYQIAWHCFRPLGNLPGYTTFVYALSINHENPWNKRHY